MWRQEITEAQAVRTLEAFENSPIVVRTHRRLGQRAWQLADRLGWAKTYDAEYLGLAQLLSCRVVTLDGRLRRGAASLGLVITPGEL